MANTTNFSVRMDKELKAKSEALFLELGMNLTTAINIFLRQSVRVGGIPFNVTVHVPNEVTLAALQEAQILSADPAVKKYSNVEDALLELKR